MGRVWKPLFGLLLLAACGGDESPEVGPVIADSAGMRIVTHRSPPVAAGTLGARPLLRVGADPTEPVSLYRVVGGVLLPQGGMVLANGGSHEILYLSRDGALQRRAGREGDGPGEFRAVSWLQGRADGGVNVGDSRSLRVTAYDSVGELQWSRPFTPSVDPPTDPNQLTVRGFVLSATDAGAFLAYPSAAALLTGAAGLLPVVGTLGLYSPDGSGFEERGKLTTITWYEDPTEERIPLGNMLGGTRIWFSGHSNRMAYTESSSFQIDVLDDGARTMLIREVRPRIALEPDSIPESVVFVAESQPAYEALVVDSGRRIWVRAPIGRASTEWRVFAADGTYVGALALPEDAEVLDAHGSHVLLLRRDQFDVESVELWEISWAAL